MNTQSQEISRKIDDLLTEWEAHLTSDPGLADSLPGRIKFVLSDLKERDFVISGAPAPALLQNSEQAYDCCIMLPALTLLAIASGEPNPQVAFVQGKIKISGDTSLALRLNNLFEKTSRS